MTGAYTVYKNFIERATVTILPGDRIAVVHGPGGARRIHLRCTLPHAGSASVPRSAVAYSFRYSSARWLGLLRRDRAHLERALNLAPDDVPVRRCLVDWILSDVEYAMHHLAESQFLGEVEATRQVIAEGRSVAEDAPDRTTVVDMLSEIDGYDALLRDWEEFSAEPRSTFPEWCAARGRSYRGTRLCTTANSNVTVACPRCKASLALAGVASPCARSWNGAMFSDVLVSCFV